MYKQLQFLAAYATRRIHSAIHWAILPFTMLAFTAVTAVAKAADKPEDYTGGGIRWDWAKIFVDAVDYYASNFRGLAIVAGCGLAAIAVGLFVFVSRSDHRSSEMLTWVARIIAGLAFLIVLPVILKIIVTGADKVKMGAIVFGLDAF